jgi:hypothetical protein
LCDQPTESQRLAHKTPLTGRVDETTKCVLSQPAAPVQSEDLARDLNTSPPEIAASSLSSGAGVLVAQPDAAPAIGAASENRREKTLADYYAEDAKPARRLQRAFLWYQVAQSMAKSLLALRSADDPWRGAISVSARHFMAEDRSIKRKIRAQLNDGARELVIALGMLRAATTKGLK